MNKRKTRPTQLLYVPPARRNSKKLDNDDMNHRAKGKANQTECQTLNKNNFALDVHESAIPKVEHCEKNCEPEPEPEPEITPEIIENEPKRKTEGIESQQKEDVLKNMGNLDVNENSELKQTADSQLPETSVQPHRTDRTEATNNDTNFIINLAENQLCSKNDIEIDKEKEEMKRAVVKINRKSRSLIKHYEEDNVLHIYKQELEPQNSLMKPELRNSQKSISSDRKCTWEDILHDDERQKARYAEDDGYHDDCIYPSKTSDSLSFIDKKLEDLDHVIEVYDFPDSFKTQDIMQIYSDVQREPMYIKWCDNTHALLVFSSPAQAKMALKYDKGIIKARSLIEASSQSKKIANKVDLKPAMRRPVTNMQTARRLINNHLGTKVNLSKEDLEKEKRALKDAKEKKRLQRQSENDAWEGHPRTNI